MIYVYRAAASQGARDLAENLSRNARKTADLSRVHYGAGLRAGDVVICWGEQLQPVTGVRILNGGPIRTKFQDAITLRQAGVPTIEVSRTRPLAQQQPAPSDPFLAQRDRLQGILGSFINGAPFQRGPVFRDASEEVVQAIRAVQLANNSPIPQAPPPVLDGQWHGRLNSHVGGADLLRPPTTPDFFVKKETLTKEIRIHSFLGKSIRAGVKVPRTGFSATGENGLAQAHPWIRSYEGGWSIQYDDFKSKEAQRNLAHQAVTALGLQFGAVDIGIKADGSLIVLEVNRAAGLEGGTVTAYASAVDAWLAEAA